MQRVEILRARARVRAEARATRAAAKRALEILEQANLANEHAKKEVPDA